MNLCNVRFRCGDRPLFAETLRGFRHRHELGNGLHDTAVGPQRAGGDLQLTNGSWNVVVWRLGRPNWGWFRRTEFRPSDEQGYNALRGPGDVPTECERKRLLVELDDCHFPSVLFSSL